MMCWKPHGQIKATTSFAEQYDGSACLNWKD